jgi:hypothetical protein
MDVLGEEDKNKDNLAQVTPLVPINSPISREEHLASLDSLKSSMRLEMVAMFEEYIGKKPPGPTDPNTTPCVDLTLMKVKPSNKGSPSAKNIGALSKEKDGLVKGASIPDEG